MDSDKLTSLINIERRALVFSGSTYISSVEAAVTGGVARLRVLVLNATFVDLATLALLSSPKISPQLFRV